MAVRAAILLSLCLAVSGPACAETPPAEAKRIEHLIRSIEQLSNAKFIRNGAPYEAKAAADHLRLKWREAGDRVKTAQQFIELCGSRSSVSGKPYEIRFADGTAVTSEAFLRARLKELEARGK